MAEKIKRFLRLLHKHNLHQASLVIVFLALGGTLLSLTSMAEPMPKAALSVKQAVPKVTPVTVTKPKPIDTVAAEPPAVVPVAKTVTPLITVSPKVAVGSKSEPVVKSSPSSNVSGLAPTTPPSSGSSGSSTAGNTGTTTSYTSTNWSGYLSTSGTFTTISANWTVPSVSGNGTSTSADGTWVGIGGVTTADLIQAGTEDSVSASGHVTTNAFYETLPATSQTVYSMTVSAGDSMSVSLTETSTSEWTISIIDNTTSQTYTRSIYYTSTNSSAEWVEEDPSYTNGSMIPFDDFGTVTFSNASITKNGTVDNLNTGDALPITMVNSSNTPIATPSAIEDGGSSFSITYD
jgi:hypothetical protein